MGAEPSHVQLVEYQKEVIPYINWIMEDIFCRYGVSIPYFLLEFDFPDYPYQPAWLDTNGYQFNTNWGDWGYYLPWFNELLGLAFDEADLPRWQFTPWDMPPWEMPDWKFPEWEFPRWEFPDWEWPDRFKRRRQLLLDKLFPGMILEAQLQAGAKLGITAFMELQLNWTIAGTLPARLGTGVSAATELQYPDWTVKTELEAKPEVELPISIKPLFLEHTIKDKISAALGIEAPMFTEATICPKVLAMLNDQLTILYDLVPAEAVEYEFDGQTKDGYMRKYGKVEEGESWEDAWNEMVADTPDVFPSGTTIGIQFYGRYAFGENEIDKVWEAVKNRGYISFDTSSLSGKTVTSATLKIYVFAVVTLDDYETARTVNVYKLDWGTLDSTDWNGGTLVGSFDEADLVVAQYNEIDIDVDYINTEGETQFEIAFNADADGTVLTDPEDLCGGAGCDVKRGAGAFGIRPGENSTQKPQLVIIAS